jgi:hypothetical protein|nr:MAG TPA: hypothetical protein [Caudoviricetes sp.]
MYYFPYTNFHDLNLDWIIEYVKSAKRETEDLINQFENIIVQTTGDSTNKVMSQNAVTVQMNYLSSRINSLNTIVEELTAKLNEYIANLAEFETETASNFSSVRSRLTTIENTLTRFYVFVRHTATEDTINVSMSELLNYRTRANVRYYIQDSVNNFVRYAYEAYSPQSTTMMIQTLPFSNENAVYRATINTTSGNITYTGIGLIAVSQSSGTSQTSVMSQRAVTEAVNKTSLYVKFTITPQTTRCNYSFETISEYIGKSVVYCDATFTSTGKRVYCYLYNSSASVISFRGLTSYSTTSSFDISLDSNNSISYNEPVLGYIPAYPYFVISSNGETIPSSQLTILQNILNAIVVNNYSPQIYLKITTDAVTEQLYVDSANSTGFVLRNNNYIITYTTKPSATIEPVEKVFTSSATGIVRIAAGGVTGYNILKIIGKDVDLTNYYIVDADITNLIGGESTLISVSPVSGVPVILLYTNGVAFSGSWTVTCRHK